MRFVATVRAPERIEDAVAAMSAALGIPFAEARMRLAPEPPAVLARVDADRADALVGALRGGGAAAVSIEESVPADQDRVVARSFTLTDAGASFTPRFGDPVELSWTDVTVVLRGQRSARVEVERTEKSRTFSAATTVATGGVKMTRTATRSTRSTDESTEQVLLVYAKGARTVLLSERQVDFSCLGPVMQPSSTANMAELARLLRERAKTAFHDDRLLRLGRRPIAFLASGSSRAGTQAVTTTTTDTRGSLDVLAEILRTAVETGLLR